MLTAYGDEDLFKTTDITTFPDAIACVTELYELNMWGNNLATEARRKNDPMLYGNLRKLLKYIQIMPPLYVLSCAKMKKCVQTTHRTAIRNLSKKYLQISLRKDFSAECPHF